MTPGRLATAPFLVAAAAMFAVMYSTQAILPDLAREFDVSPSQAGLSVSVALAAYAIGAAAVVASLRRRRPVA